MRLIFSFVLLCLMLSSPNGTAEMLGSHNEQHAAEQFAIDALYDSGCKRTKITRSARWAVEWSDNHYIVHGLQLRVECVSKTRVYSITWDAPTSRTDGTALKDGEVAGYQILREGQIIDMTPCCEYMTKDIDGLSIRSVDVNGLVSSAVPVTM